ncbi:MAG: hypothetical protein WAL34_25115, partial [Acidobacteriaceae bacterium]
MSHQTPEEISIAERATTVGPITDILSSSSCRRVRVDFVGDEDRLAVRLLRLLVSGCGLRNRLVFGAAGLLAAKR